MASDLEKANVTLRISDTLRRIVANRDICRSSLTSDFWRHFGGIFRKKLGKNLEKLQKLQIRLKSYCFTNKQTKVTATFGYIKPRNRSQDGKNVKNWPKYLRQNVGRYPKIRSLIYESFRLERNVEIEGIDDNRKEK